MTLVTALKVSPPDWLTNPSSIKQPWQIWYRYNGTLVKVQGMNREKKHSERVKCTIELIKVEEAKLFQYGYNPITKTLCYHAVLSLKHERNELHFKRNTNIEGCLLSKR